MRRIFVRRPRRFRLYQRNLWRVAASVGAALAYVGAAQTVAAADINGTTGNDFIFFQGDQLLQNTIVVNAYSGEQIVISGNYNVNNSNYNGLAGIDTLLMTDFNDFLVIEDQGTQNVMSVETFFAGDGSDVIQLSSQTSMLGNIVIDGGSGPDILWSNQGDDFINAREGADNVHGGPGNDIINGGAGNGSSSGNDVIDGGTGADVLNGEDGDDTLRFTPDDVITNLSRTAPDGQTASFAGPINVSHDVFNGGVGNDSITMTDGADALILDFPSAPSNPFAGVSRVEGVEQIHAGGGNDLIDLGSRPGGLAYQDVAVYGDVGNDTIWTNSGDDQIIGGRGNDIAHSGVGSDLFFFDIGDGIDLVNGGEDGFDQYFDEIVFGAGIVPSSFVLTEIDESWFEIVFNDTSDFITALNIDGLRFADGSTLTLRNASGDGSDVAVPEPATIWLLLSAFLSLGLITGVGRRA